MGLKHGLPPERGGRCLGKPCTCCRHKTPRKLLLLEEGYGTWVKGKTEMESFHSYQFRRFHSYQCSFKKNEVLLTSVIRHRAEFYHQPPSAPSLQNFLSVLMCTQELPLWPWLSFWCWCLHRAVNSLLSLSLSATLEPQGFFILQNNLTFTDNSLNHLFPYRGSHACRRK